MSAADFEAVIRAHGLLPRRAVVADGRWHRCPTETHKRRQNGSWKLAADGMVGWFQDFAADGAPHVWRPEGVAKSTVVVDRSAIAQREREARQAREKATEAARAYYAACAPLTGGHPYLESHGLDMAGCYGLRVNRGGVVEMSRRRDTRGWLVVPAWRERRIMSLQMISPDGEKLFWAGADFGGGVHYPIERQGAALTVLCEGLATGLAVYAAVPTSRVLVAFTAGNLSSVPLPRTGMMVIAADNDHRTVCQRHRAEGLTAPFSPWEERPDWCLCNPGRRYAEKLAAEVGIGVALPDVRGGESDWCDWRQRRREEAWNARRPHDRVADVRRAVDAEIAGAMHRAARFRAPPSA